MARYTGGVEKISLQPCSVEHSVHRKRKREDDDNGECHGASSSGTSTVILGSWLNLEKLTGADLVLTTDATLVNNNEWKTTLEELDSKLRENSLMLIADGHLLRVADLQ